MAGDELDGFQPVKSADRTLSVLEALAAAPRAPGLGDLARELGIPKSSLHGIMRTLVRRRWVTTDRTGTLFSLGLRALRVGASFVDGDDTVAMTAPVLDWISEELGEATHLGRLDGPDVVYLAKRDSTHPLRLYSAIGRRLPAHATALGKALLATRTDAEVLRTLPARLSRLTKSTITDHDRLLDELHRFRSDGYAVDNEENSEGIRCFAVALTPTSPGPSTDAISISVPTYRLDGAMESSAIGLLRDVDSRLVRGS